MTKEQDSRGDMEHQHEPRNRRAFSDGAVAEATGVAKNIHIILKDRPATKGITIDGPTSKDLDDALWVERNPQGGYVLHISIADVGSVLTPQVAPLLEKEVYERAFTRYYTQGSTPMLPHLLSESALSLLEGQCRPTITISIPLDAHLTPGEPDIRCTSLISSRRFHYQEVDEEIGNPQTEYGPMLQDAFRIAQVLLQQRRAKGALALYDLYAGWATTEEGVLVRLEERQRNKAHIIIQECMILANQAFALFLAQRGVPALYRNHVAKAIAPERSLLLQMIDTALSLQDGAHLERVRATVNLALERARYAPTIAEHFGLNVPVYIHMTSPLRRYPDLVNQRILHAILAGEPAPCTPEALQTIANHVNVREDETKDATKAHFLKQYDSDLQRIMRESEDSPETSTRPLAHLDAKQFHSVLRMAAEGHVLPPAIEQELFRRLEDEQLSAHDLFTVLFRFQNSGESWEHVKQVGLQWLQNHPHHAISLFMMGRQALGWDEPTYEISTDGQSPHACFRAHVQVHIEGQHYTSGLHTARQKERARQRACAELLAHIAGVAVSLTPDETLPEVEHASSLVPVMSAVPSLSEAEPVSFNEQHNYKGQLQEVAQVQKWENPVYRETGKSGPPHAPIFTVEGTMLIGSQTYTTRGSGRTKGKAEHHAAQQLLLLIAPFITPVARPAADVEKNAVSLLNEMKQQAAIHSVTYTYEPLGAPHERTFTCVCTIIADEEQVIETTGSGKTKKEASQDAASQAVLFLS